MKQLIYLLCFSLCGVSSTGLLIASDHGGVHIHLRCGEDVEDETKTPECCMETKPWYCNQHYDYYEHIEDQAERLHEDSSWPGEREEFSDKLMR